jgi:hypothetical protein
MTQQPIAWQFPHTATATARDAEPLPLQRAATCRLNGDRRGAEIRCSRGLLWVTQPRDPRDYVLRAGEGMAITRRGPILIQALSDSAVQLTPAERRR